MIHQSRVQCCLPRRNGQTCRVLLTRWASRPGHWKVCRIVSITTTFSGLTLRVAGRTRQTTVKNLEITKEPLAATRTSVTQPRADKILAIPIIPKPIPAIPMGRLIPTARGSGRENKLCNSSATTFQVARLVQPDAGLPSKISAALKHRRPMLPTPRKSQFPRLAQHAIIVDGSSSNTTRIIIADGS